MEKLYTGTGKSYTGYCGVLAVANVANVELATAANVFIKLCKRSPNKWKGGTRHQDRVKVLNHYKVKWEEFKTVPMTLSHFVDQHTVKGKTYIITTTSHVQLVKDGIVTDQRGSFPVSDYWGKKKRLKKFQIKIK